jgi:hypothetical protein
MITDDKVNAVDNNYVNEYYNVSTLDGIPYSQFESLKGSVFDYAEKCNNNYRIQKISLQGIKGLFFNNRDKYYTFDSYDSYLKDKLKIVIDKIDNAESVFEYQASVLEIKRVDVLNMTCLPDVNIAAKLTDVNDILEEFKQKLDTQNINSEVDSIMNSQRNDDIVDSNVSDDEVAAFYDKL